MCPVCPGPSGSGRWKSPFLGRDRRAVQARPAPVDLTGRVQALQQDLMQVRPDPRLLPVAHPTPATHPAAAAHLSRQHLSGQPGAQDEQDTGQRRPVLERTSAALRTWPGRRQMRGDLAPEIIGLKRSCHADRRPTKRSVPVLLGALRSRCSIAAKSFHRRGSGIASSGKQNGTAPVCKARQILARMAQSFE